MPTDANGDKWSCEICVRGHRATRCDHFDRWMIKVKRPGRPLHECPHVDGACRCTSYKVAMVKVPKRGGCDCQVLRYFDKNIDEGKITHSRQTPPQLHDPLGPTPTTPYQNFQPFQQFPGSRETQYQAFAQHIENIRTTAGTANGQDVRADLSHGLHLQDTMRPQQPASDPSWSDQATSAATLTTPTQGTQVPHQAQSESVVQPQFSTTVQDGLFLPSLGPDSNVYANLQLPPAQPQFAPHCPYQPTMNGYHGQHTPEISTFTHTPDPNHRVDPAHPLTMARGFPSEGLGDQYPGPRDSFPIISAAEPSAEQDALMGSQNCLCGPACECIVCATHPYNAATRERVQDLHRIMGNENDGSVDHYYDSQPQPRYGADPTNDTINTITEPVMVRGQLPLSEESLPYSPHGWLDMPIQSPAFQPTVNEGTSVDYGDNSIDFSLRTMRNSGYYTMEYPVNSNCTDATGTCLCGSDCTCSGCLTHQGHGMIPN